MPSWHIRECFSASRKLATLAACTTLAHGCYQHLVKAELHCATDVRVGQVNLGIKIVYSVLKDVVMAFVRAMFCKSVVIPATQAWLL